MKHTLLTLAILALFSLGQSQAKTIYVKAGATGSHTGTSWATAYDNLQTALDAALSGDHIWVATGTYYPSVIAGSSTDDRDKTFLLRDNVRIYGGFAGTEAGIGNRDTSLFFTDNAAILSGNLGAADSSDNAYHVLLAVDINAYMDGFVIRDGNANGSGGNLIAGKSIVRDYGGGMYHDNSSSGLYNLKIENNFALTGGAGMNNVNGTSTSRISIISSVFSNNRIDGVNPADGGGAAICNNYVNILIRKSVLENNTALYCRGGGAIFSERSQLNANNCLFRGNHSGFGDGGGAIYNAGSSFSTGSYCSFYNSDFINNTTANRGGAMYNYNAPGLSSLLDTFINNSADEGGGAVANTAGSSVDIEEALFSRNSTAARGGAIENRDRSNPFIFVITFDTNTAGAGGGAIYNYSNCSPEIASCRFNGNTTAANGGAMGNEDNANPLILICNFHGNVADSNGAAVYNCNNSSPGIVNCLITHNKAGLSGGGVYSGAGAALPCNAYILNTTIVSNEAENSGGGWTDDGAGAPGLYNSIVSGNNAPVATDVEVPASIGATSLMHNIVGDQYLENGSSLPVAITSDIFVDTLAGDYRLAAGSYAIDRGDSSYYTTGYPEDMRNAERIMGLNIDLGAYETCTDTLNPELNLIYNPSGPFTAGAVVRFSVYLSGSVAGKGLDYYWLKNGTVVATGTSYIAVAGTDFADGDLISVKTFYPSIYNCNNPDTLRSKTETMHIYDPVGLSEISLATHMQVVPNPNHGDFLLHTGLPEGKACTLRISDITGREVYTEQFVSATAQPVQLNGKLQPGTYLLTLSAAGYTPGTIRYTLQ